MVTVLDVDLKRKRISLSMKGSQSGHDAVPKSEKKKEERRPERKPKEKERFTNNPFAEAFRNRKP